MFEIKVPHLGTNDDFAEVTWLRNGVCQAGESIAMLETTKAVFDIMAEADGLPIWQVAVGDDVKVGTVMGHVKSR